MSLGDDLTRFARKAAPALNDYDLAEVTADWLLAPEGAADARSRSADFLRRVQRRLEARREFGQAALVAALVSSALAPDGAP
jgi:hypothetical protein